jgi:hypothetical protein
MRPPINKDADARFLRLAGNGQPMTREKAIEALSALVSAGRLRSPSSGGPPPAIPSFDPGGGPECGPGGVETVKKA